MMLTHKELLEQEQQWQEACEARVRIYERYYSGRITETEFAKALAMNWPSGLLSRKGAVA